MGIFHGIQYLSPYLRWFGVCLKVTINFSWKKKQFHHKCPTKKYPLNWGYLYSLADFRTHQTDLHVPWSTLMHLLHGLWSSIPCHGKPYDDPCGRNSFASSFCWLILNYTPENPCMAIKIQTGWSRWSHHLAAGSVQPSSAVQLFGISLLEAVQDSQSSSSWVLKFRMTI